MSQRFCAKISLGGKKSSELKKKVVEKLPLSLLSRLGPKTTFKARTKTLLGMGIGFVNWFLCTFGLIDSSHMN